MALVNVLLGSIDERCRVRRVPLDSIERFSSVSMRWYYFSAIIYWWQDDNLSVHFWFVVCLCIHVADAWYYTASYTSCTRHLSQMANWRLNEIIKFLVFKSVKRMRCIHLLWFLLLLPLSSASSMEFVLFFTFHSGRAHFQMLLMTSFDNLCVAKFLTSQIESWTLCTVPSEFDIFAVLFVSELESSR